MNALPRPVILSIFQRAVELHTAPFQQQFLDRKEHLIRLLRYTQSISVSPSPREAKLKRLIEVLIVLTWNFSDLTNQRQYRLFYKNYRILRHFMLNTILAGNIVSACQSVLRYRREAITVYRQWRNHYNVLNR